MSQNSISFVSKAGNVVVVTPVEADYPRVRVEVAGTPAFETNVLWDAAYENRQDEIAVATRKAGCRAYLSNYTATNPDGEKIVVVPVPTAVADPIAALLGRQPVATWPRNERESRARWTDADLHDYLDSKERAARHYETTTEEQAIH